jgi:hypothetical protein
MNDALLVGGIVALVGTVAAGVLIGRKVRRDGAIDVGVVPEPAVA